MRITANDFAAMQNNPAVPFEQRKKTIDLKAAEKDYLTVLSLNEAARKYNVNSMTLRKLFIDADIPVRDRQQAIEFDARLRALA